MPRGLLLTILLHAALFTNAQFKGIGGMAFHKGDIAHFTFIHSGDTTIHLVEDHEFVNLVQFGSSAYHKDSNHYSLILVDTNGSNRSVVLDVSSGYLVSDVPASRDIAVLEIDAISQQIYGFTTDSNGVNYYIGFNAYSGIPTVLDTLDYVSTIYGGTSVIDVQKREFIFIGRDTFGMLGQTRNFVLDLTTGGLKADTVISQLAYLQEIDHETGKIYALWYNSSNMFFLVNHEPRTNSITILDSIPFLRSPLIGTTLFNSDMNLYVFTGEDTNGMKRTFMMDSTGTLINSWLADPLMVLPEFCSSNTTGFEEVGSHPLIVYPNPGEGLLNFSSDQVIKEIILFDVYGREEGRYSPGGSDFTLDLSHLPSGIYFYSCPQNHISGSFLINR